jgi:hypothetical protein
LTGPVHTASIPLSAARVHCLSWEESQRREPGCAAPRGRATPGRQPVRFAPGAHTGPIFLGAGTCSPIPVAGARAAKSPLQGTACIPTPVLTYAGIRRFLRALAWSAHINCSGETTHWPHGTGVPYTLGRLGGANAPAPAASRRSMTRHVASGGTPSRRLQSTLALVQTDGPWRRLRIGCRYAARRRRYPNCDHSCRSEYWGKMVQRCADLQADGTPYAAAADASTAAKCGSTRNTCNVALQARGPPRRQQELVGFSATCFSSS